MRNFTLMFMLAALFVGCQGDSEFNMPSIQGEVDTVFYRATNTSATINDDGSVTITGQHDDGTVVLKFAEYEVGNYGIDGNMSNTASFTTEDNVNYITNDEGEGIINVVKIENGELFGDFYFNAYREGVGDTLNFSRGSFFGVPLTNPTPPTGPSQACIVAQADAAQAEMTFDQTNPNDTQAMTDNCNAYKAALESQMQECGDSDGSIQDEIDTLGDCTF
ncbi:DUF6252 family protein [Mesonia sp. K7]|uniref:DUF6252 family protein n=1 Tax=Mesonia sp. K7 TaxID=2218606 RepID=UPI000DA92E18|nr:DUF6252 family protein [Mesonia sp. K7]PZD77712.1 hypothetical protein DNG35_07705 [Mesonia sp. K7]